MAAILASQGCYCNNIDLINQGRAMDNLSFSSSISSFERKTCNPILSNKAFLFHVEMRQTESSSRVGTNGRPVKMVPASEVVKRNNLPNGKVNKMVNGTKQVINVASFVKKNSTSTLVKAPKGKGSNELPLVEELKVLPSDESFSWANENYNSWQRTIDVWSFVLSLRLHVLFDNAKWAYLGGFSEDKQVDEAVRLASNCDQSLSLLISYFPKFFIIFWSLGLRSLFFFFSFFCFVNNYLPFRKTEDERLPHG